MLRATTVHHCMNKTDKKPDSVGACIQWYRIKLLIAVLYELRKAISFTSNLLRFKMNVSQLHSL